MVGSILGRESVNINFMTVAPASFKTLLPGSEMKDPLKRLGGGIGASNPGIGTPREASEALMILGVDREVSPQLMKELVEGSGVLSVSSVTL